MNKKSRPVFDLTVSIVLGIIMLGIGVWIFGPVVVIAISILTVWLKRAINKSGLL